MNDDGRNDECVNVGDNSAFAIHPTNLGCFFSVVSFVKQTLTALALHSMIRCGAMKHRMECKKLPGTLIFAVQ